MMHKQMNIYRQGDVLLVEVRNMPEGKPETVARDSGRIVLAHGEVTGHSHAIAEREAEMVQFADGERYLRVGAPVTVRHEEHDAITLPPATYRVVIQREYTPDEIRRVVD